MRVYFAGPLFCEAERVFNLRLTEKLEAQGYEVFLPQRDGAELQKPPYNNMPNDELQKTIFKRDRDKLIQADIFLFVLDGRVPDEGGCVELGIAYGQKHFLQQDKLLIGLHTDMRVAFPDGKLNAMISGALDFTMSNEEELIAKIEAFGSARNARV
ncbi:MAG TPA: nucleoside 2-deoxyribosyltransferase [Anaerolineales bacterium]|nr:nucleoside 2-deoxyribosyltransferase [Anaerolineales bacterium]